MARIEADRQFWDELEAANKELEPTGLYMTHRFTDEQVVLTSDWLEKIAPLQLQTGFSRLELFRPAGADLILAKMMRNDPQDVDDIRFLIAQEKISPTQLQQVFANARVPAVPEIIQTFQAMQPTVLALAGARSTRTADNDHRSCIRVGIGNDRTAAGSPPDRSTTARHRQASRRISPERLSPLEN